MLVAAMIMAYEKGLHADVLIRFAAVALSGAWGGGTGSNRVLARSTGRFRYQPALQ